MGLYTKIRNIMKLLFKVFLFLVAAGVIYWWGFYQTPEQKEFKKTLAIAEKGNGAAQLRIGDFYAQGYGVEKSGKQAIEWYRKSFQNGTSQAAWKLAQTYIEQKNWDEAATYLQVAVQDKNAAAENELGRFYEEGLGGLPKHRGQSFYWRILAAQKGDQIAAQWLKQEQQNDPDFYDKEQAFADNLQAAEAGNVAAMLQVARSYQEGDDILQDMQQAEQWFTKAWQERKEAQIGYELAQFYLNKKNPLADEEKGVSLLAELAELSYAPAQYTLGERSYQEDPPNYKDAFAWFSNAAANADARGQYMTGFMLMQGQGMTCSVPLAIRFFKQAAEQEHADAQYVLGQIYYKGLGVAADKKAGEQWIQRASQNGSVPAQAFLESISTSY